MCLSVWMYVCMCVRGCVDMGVLMGVSVSLYEWICVSVFVGRYVYV